MKSNGLLKGTLVLTILGFVSKTLGALFKITLVNIVGSKGMGIYGIIFPLFVFFTLLSSEGFCLALTMNIAKHKKDGLASLYKKRAFITILSLSLLAFVFICLFQNFISALQGNVADGLLYMVVGVSVVIVALGAFFKAVFRGEEALKLFSVVEILEDVAKVVFALIFAFLLRGLGENMAIVGVFLGIIISGVVSIFASLFCGKQYLSLKAGGKTLAREDISTYYKFSFILTLKELVVPLIQFIDSILIIKLLLAAGISHSGSTSLFGISRGSISAILNLPAFILVAFEFLLLPNLARSKGNHFKEKTSLSLTLAVFASVPFVLFFIIFNTEVVTLLYGNSFSIYELTVAAKLLKLGAVSIVFSAITSIMVVGLEAKENSFIPFIASVIAGVFKIIFTIIFVPKFSIFAVELSSVLFCMAECLIILMYARRKRLYNKVKFLVLILIFWIFVMMLVRGLFNFFAPYVGLIVNFILSVGIVFALLIIITLIICLILGKNRTKLILDKIFNL